MSDLVLTPEARRIAELLSVTCAVKNTHFCIRKRGDKRIALCVYAWYKLTHNAQQQISPDMVNVTVNVGFNTKLAVEQILE